MMLMRKLMPWLFWGGLAALIWWLWHRQRDVNVHATVTIPQDEIVVSQKPHAIMTITTDASQGDQSRTLGINGPLFGPGF